MSKRVPDESPTSCPNGLLSRRQAIQVGAVAAGGAALGWPSDEAEANPLLWWALRTTFTAALGWLVHRLLDRTFPESPDLLDVRHDARAQPSPDAFHNRWAEPLTIGNPAYHIQAGYSLRGGCYLNVGPHVSASLQAGTFAYGDLNLPEMERSRDEFQGLLIPTGKREAAGQDDGQLVAACRKYGRTPDEFALDYVRRFLVPTTLRDNLPIQSQVGRRIQQQQQHKGKPKTLLGYGITERTSGQRLLLVV
jgi:hypothetical protein